MVIYIRGQDMLQAARGIMEKGGRTVADFKSPRCLGLLNGVKSDENWPYKDWPEKIFDAPAQQEMMTLLFSVVDKLTSNAYVGMPGVNTLTVMGPRGLGKSGILDIFADVGGVLYDNLVVLHYSFIKVGESGNPIYDTPLIMKAAELLNVVNGPGSLFDEIVKDLKLQDKYLLVVVDELDKLYQQEPTDKLVQHLKDINALGNDGSGRVYTLLCGSSSSLLDLIGKKTDPDLTMRFPMLKRSQDLNKTKFHGKRVRLSAPNNLDAVAAQMKVELSIDNLREIAFVTGANARNICRYIMLNQLPEYSVPINSFLARLMEALSTKNGEWLDKIIDTPANIKTLDWENQAKPLTVRDIHSIWTQYRKENSGVVPSWDQLLNESLDLGHIVLCGAGVNLTLFPATFQLLLEYRGNTKLDQQPSFWAKLQAKLNFVDFAGWALEAGVKAGTTVMVQKSLTKG